MKIEQHVFVVDDNLSTRIGLTRLLNAAGFSVHSFASFYTFLEFIRPMEFLMGEKHGCILLDASIPGFETTELKKKLSKLGKGQKLEVIFFTADDEEETRMKARELNAVGFFRKPVDGIALLDAIKWALKNDNAISN